MTKQILKAYKVRLYPNEDQQIFFAKSFGCTRFIWNRMLADKIDYYQATKTTLNNTPAQYKKEFEWLKEVDSLALANVQQNLRAAYSKFFKGGTGFPKFKKKGIKDSYTTNNQKGTVAITDSTVKLPKIGHINAKFPDKINGLIKSATISRTPSGKYFASLLVETIVNELPKTQSNIGIDLGLTDFIVLSDGCRVANPKFLAKLQDKLAREQKILAKRRAVAKADQRKLSESRNYQKQKIKVAKVYEKITNTRKDFLHKLSFNIIKNHDVIAIEDLNVKGMVKNRKLAKAISDSSWSSFTTMLAYKAEWYGKTLVKIDRWYPSSKTCSNCGHLLTKAELPLSVRSWNCPSCLQENDRDLNASINILNQGLILAKHSKTVGATGLA
ncbi:IS200/IS605 family element RNA-guided endonuclease TnpB [Psychrobacter sp. AOP22-C1-22]|uniref:IS200/IS605 family element RNA-guided endonuclease TnpB n=1 Tax=unclassified Psychrobacter TaxID=196806 RepID=UPI00178831BB|nr:MULTISPECIES: IS200/IS605 family element RNA-guided endonuclease TnpB [unclassified Psychrobacter]MBE0406931.1 IS200/IS605 family element transposase accessory protein TnpB [Psychrobacter sp. FME6]MBE0443861.1 IS200/IS605 family element transposase accessory protein TnpB [Psychrobacter sp. FME5]MDN5801346.1 IS200/IS605 family element RNA-guided endonuclease TnpB [Psychrobacter sp.]MDN5897511.1 IS200/IS605 family element RNA-guided endonuclease TnpB [Psychrobacter sp.]